MILKPILLRQLVLASGLMIGGVLCRPARAEAQLAVQQAPRTRRAPGHDERPPAVRAAFGLSLPGERDARLDPGLHRALVPTRGGDQVDVHLPVSSHAAQNAKRGSRGKHVLIGVLLGGAAGAVKAIAFPAKCRPSTSDVPCALGAPIELAVDMSAGALIGGLIGAVLPARR
jgi:hypothetical protein